MGCCASRDAEAPASSHSNGNVPNSRASGDAAGDENDVPAANAPRAVSNNNSGRPNTNLRAPKAWRSTSRTWTKQQLVREREIFWETQVTGSQEIWAALHLAVDMMRGDREANQAPDLKGAKTILDAAGCTCPTGRIGEGVWDEQGRLYKMPRWVVSDPINVVEGPGTEDEDDDAVEDEEVEEDEDAKEGVKEYLSEPGIDKGKEKIPSGPNAVTLTTRLSDRGTDIRLVVDKKQPVKTVVRRVQAEANIDTKVKVKLAYMGRILKDSESLEGQGWKPGHVVNALVFNV